MMPAAKHFDPLLGIDIHIIQPPGPVPPVPIPHPHIGVVMDPMDYIPFIGATVTVFGLKRAQAGTAGLSVPHIPIGGIFVKPPGNESEIFMGSATVSVDGDAFSYLALPVLSCHDIGMPGPPRAKGSPPKSLVLPTTVVLSIPLPVLVGGPPTISLMALGMRLGMAALGKALAKVKTILKGSKKAQKVSQKIHRAANKVMDRLGIPPGARAKVHKAICNVTGHPVDTATGAVFTEATDFTLDGAIALRWEREWHSRSGHQGMYGRGWHGPMDMELWEDARAVVVRLDDGRWIPFAPPGPQGSFNQSHSLFLHRHPTPSGSAYRLENFAGVGWVFGAPVAKRFPDAKMSQFALLEIVDRCGNRITLRRDHERRLRNVVDATGRRLDFNHDERGRVVSITGPHPSDPQARINLVQYRYDRDGDMREAVDALGATTRYTYRDGLLVSEVDRCGMEYSFEWTGKLDAARCARTWGTGNLFARTFRYERRRTSWTDSLGGNHAVDVDEEDRVTAEHDPLGHVQTVEYDEDGLPLITTEADGRKTFWKYDERKRVIAITEPGNLTTTFAYDDNNAMTEVVYPDGSKRIRTYDDRGCLIGEIEPDGTEWVYGTDARGLRTRDVVNGQELMRYRWSPGGEPAGFETDAGVRRYELDLLGRIAREVGPDGTALVFQRDLAGRLLALRSSTGEVETYELDPEGRVTSITNALGQVERFERDPAGRVKRHQDASGRTLRYTYDTESHVLSVVDANGRAFRYTYNGQGWVATEQDPIGRRTELQRDPDGRVVQRKDIAVDGSERNHAYGYDARGRLTEIRRGDGHVRQVAWDVLDRMIAIRGDEHVVPVEREYDRRGHVIREKIGDLELRSEFTGNDLAARVYPEGRRIEFEWSANGDPSRISVDGADIAHYEYDSEDREIRRRSAGATAGRVRGVKGRIGSQWIESSDAPGRAVWRRDVAYDAAGRSLGCRDSRFGSETYQVGANGELLQVWRNERAEESLARDASGNLLGTPPALDEVRGQGEAKRRWDSEGRLTQRSSADGRTRTTIRWNEANLLVGAIIERDDQVRTWLDLHYDGFARLVRKRVRTDDGQIVDVRWLWDGDVVAGERRTEWTEADPERRTQDRDFVLHPLDLRPLVLFEGDDPLLIETDQAHFPRVAVDACGQVTWAIDFDALGRARAGDVDVRHRVPFRFLGQWEDEDLGLYYNRHRWYDPELGAYLTPDPLGLRGGPLTWNYAPNPFDGWDPFGLFHHNDPGHYVYGLYDPPSPPAPGQKPYYVGITNNTDARAGQHADAGRMPPGTHMQTLDGPVTYGQARGYEQAYIEHHGTKTGTPGDPMGTKAKPLQGTARGNRINSFDVNNKTRPKARQKAFNQARKAKLDSLKNPCS